MENPTTCKRRRLVKPDDKYNCVKCRQLIIQPMQLECGHRICKICCEELKKSGMVLKCPTNENECEDTIDLNQIFLDRSFHKEIMKQPVYCIYNDFGCEQTFQWAKIQVHELECRYKEKICEHCNQIISIYELKNHIKNICMKVLLPCPFKCSPKIFYRHELENHKEICSHKPSFCKYKTLGCQFEGTAEEVTQHEADKIKHFDSLYNEMLRNRENVIELTIKTKEMNSILENLKKTDVINTLMSTDVQALIKEDIKTVSLQLKKEFDVWKHRIEQETTTKVNAALSNFKPLTAFPVEMRQRFFNHEESIAELNNLLISQINSTMSTDVQAIIKGIKTVSLLLRTELAILEHHIELVTTTYPTLSNFMPTISFQDEIRQRFYDHDESIAGHGKLLASQDLRLQCLETANYGGVLVWKIAEYRRHKQQALSGHILSLYSQPFYTDHYGYKMCARVYLNGDGIGKGTHLSLFFAIMKGDFDDILPWPFCRKVTFMLLDQKTNKRHLIDSFKPDKSSSSFQKPTTSMNIASGCPLFVAHTTLENAEELYLRNNIIYLKVIVDK